MQGARGAEGESGILIVKRSNRRGFSLVELLIAIAILAILGAISIPTFRHYLAQRRLNGAVRELQNSLMAMRMQAVTENRWIAMNIGSNHQFTIFRDVNKNGVMDSVEAVSVKDIHPTYYDVTFTGATGAVLTFYPDGTASTGTICIHGAPGLKPNRLSLNKSGRIRVEETAGCP